MTNKIMVPKEYINKIYGDINEIKYITTDKNVLNKIIEIQKFIDNNIINTENELLNIIKKMVYKRLKETMYKEPGKNKELYKLHNELKESKVNYMDATNELYRIENKYKVIE